MKKFFQYIFVIAGFISLQAISANAQAPSNAFEGLSYNNRKNTHDGATSHAYTLQGNESNMYNDTTAGFRIQRGRDMNPTYGPPSKEEAATEALSNVTPKSRTHFTTIYGPMTGFVETMNSNVYFDVISKTITGPLALYHTGMSLVEPAIETGYHNSANEANGFQNSRYLAETSLLNHIYADPETKEVNLTNYTSCIANRVRDRVLAGGEDEASWIEAQSRCMADRTEKIEDLVPGAHGFNDLRMVNNAVNAGYDFFYNPNGNNFYKGQGVKAGADDRNEIYLTDILYNSSSLTSGGHVDQIKTDFRSLFGDYKFTMDKPPSGAGGRSASRDLEFEKIAPTKTIPKLAAEKEKEIFKTIMDMTKARCKELLNPTQPRADFTSRPAFCRPDNNDMSADKMINVSANGFQMTCTMIDIIVHRFEIQVSYENQQNPAICNLKNDREDVIKQIKTIQGRDGYRSVDYLARNIALAQVLSIASNAETTVNAVASTGGDAALAMSFAENLITESVGNQSPAAAAAEVIENLHEFVPKIQDETAKSVGKGGTKIADVIEDSRPIDSAGSFNGTGGAGQ